MRSTISLKLSCRSLPGTRWIESDSAAELSLENPSFGEGIYN